DRVLDGVGYRGIAEPGAEPAAAGDCRAPGPIPPRNERTLTDRRPGGSRGRQPGPGGASKATARGHGAPLLPGDGREGGGGRAGDERGYGEDHAVSGAASAVTGTRRVGPGGGERPWRSLTT